MGSSGRCLLELSAFISWEGAGKGRGILHGGAGGRKDAKVNKKLNLCSKTWQHQRGSHGLRLSRDFGVKLSVERCERL